MKAKYILISTFCASVAFAQPSDDRDRCGGTFIHGVPLGEVSFRVCTQTADDATPSLGGFPPGGCNYLLTSTSHSGPLTITNLDDVLAGVDWLGEYDALIWIIGSPAANQTTIADGGNFRLKYAWTSPTSGDHSVLELKADYQTGSITHFADAGGGQVTVTSNGHGLQTNQTVTISGSTNYNGTFTATNIAANTFEITDVWVADDAAGTWVSIRLDESNRSGNVIDYFYQNVLINQGNLTDFPYAQLVVGQADTAAADGNNIGIVGEALAASARNGLGVLGYGKASAALPSVGVKGVAVVTVTGDTATAYGLAGHANATHAGGQNVGVYLSATNGATNYAIEIAAGDISTTAAATNWVLKDNDTSALSFDATGGLNILELDTSDGYETVKHAARIYSSANAITSAGTADYAASIVGTLNDTTAGGGTQQFDGLKVTLTETDKTGWDAVNLLNLIVGTSSMLYVSDDGIIHGSNGETISNVSDGQWILCAVGGNAECLSIDLGTTSNTVTVASSTGVLDIDFGSIDLNMGNADLDGDLNFTGGGSITSSSAGNITVAPDGAGYVDILNTEMYVGDGTYAFSHTPKLGVEGTLECIGDVYGTSFNTAGINMGANSFTVHATGSVYYDDDVDVWFGDSNDSGCSWDTSLSPDAFKCTYGAGFVQQGTGGTSTEDLKTVWGDTSNQVDISSSTGVNMINYGSIGLTVGSISMGGDLDMNDYNIIDPDVVYAAAPATDTAPKAMDIHAGNAYSQSTGGNQTGANLNLSAGIGVRQITIDDWNNCSGDTVTLSINGASTVCTESGGGCTWTAGVSNDSTATSLANAIEALSYLSALAIGAVVYIIPDDSLVNTLDLAENDSTCTTLTEGTDGYVYVGDSVKMDTTAFITSDANSHIHAATNADGSTLTFFETFSTLFDTSHNDRVGLYACTPAGLCLDSYDALVTGVSTNSSAAGINSYLYSAANAAGEYGVMVGSSDTSTAQINLASCNDIDGTPDCRMTVDGLGKTTSVSFATAGFDMDASEFTAHSGSEIDVDDDVSVWFGDRAAYCKYDTGLAPDALHCDYDGGGFTQSGTGSASSEDLNTVFGNTSNIVDVSSTTGVTTIDYGSIGLACGNLDVSDGNITNVGSVQLDSLVCDADANVIIGLAAGTINYGINATGNYFQMSANGFAIDDPTTGGHANSPYLMFSGNHLDGANNYEGNSQVQFFDTVDDPFLRISVDDSLAAGNGNLTGAVDIYDTGLVPVTAAGDLGATANPWHNTYTNTCRVGTDSFTADANYILHVYTSVAGGGARITGSDAGVSGVNLVLEHLSASPADGDVTGTIFFNGQDSQPADQSYSKITSEIQDKTHGSEESIVRHYASMAAGALTEFFRLDGTDGIAAIVTSVPNIGEPEVADVAPSPRYINGELPYSQATGTNRNASYVCINPGIPTMFYTVVSNTAGAVTITTTINGTSTALASTTDFALGSDDTAPQLLVTAQNIAAKFAATSALSTYVTATASVASVYLTWKPTACTAYVATNQAGRISTTIGSNNIVAFGGSSAGKPYGIQPLAALAGYVQLVDSSTSYLGIKVNSVNTGSYAALSGNGLVVDAATYIGWNGLSYMYSKLAGHLTLSSSASTTGTGISLDFDTANRLLAETNAASPLALGELVPSLQATSAAIDVSSVARQTLYTVPAGFTFYPTKIVVRGASAAITLATGGFGCDTPAQDFLADQALTALGDSTDVISLFPPSGTKYESCAAASTFAYDGTVAEAAADTVIFEVWGVLR